MLSKIINLLAQSLFFLLGVYLQKFIRKRFFSYQTRKRLKSKMRISACIIMTTILLIFNYGQRCEPFGIGTTQCFYLTFDATQIFHTLMANSLLFGWHIYQKFIEGAPDRKFYSFKNIVIAPFFEQLLFRACFFRISGKQLSTYYSALIFSISHLHKPLRKYVKGKETHWKGSIGQVIFTFVFAIYSFYFFKSWNSVIPSIFLHCYCNLLGPPFIRKDNFFKHLGCVLAIISYCYIFVP